MRYEYNAATAYGFDRVFGPATTTRHVYDVAAQHVVSGSMRGINGTVFAYGVTSSGKTHTMHGEQKSPGIIPLAVKDVFSIIQETPGREFLLRVSYLEIYNEVINDLLDPTGQNLRIREDSQGTYVEGIKEEVVLSPAHALSLIASGEEHRHVGSNNFNLLSSRSHTIFTLTIESSPVGENQGDEDVTLSQLNLIDLAGSESSKTETTGLRRKEGSYINKSLLTLGTVISKLTDGKATHVPYRDSKLTRLLQSSLSGHGRVSLICTVTPASSNSEETHNTLKFAHRSKYVEIKASQNKIMDEKSLIKKYQKEISCLKEELEQLKRGIVEKPYTVAPDQEDLVNLKRQLEAGQVKLQSRLEEEEQAKAALMGRIQRLTKLILVSTKSTISSNMSEKTGHRRRHSFGEDELAYLPDKKRDYIVDDDAGSFDSEFSADTSSLDDNLKMDRKNRRHKMLGWFKLRKPDHLTGFSPSADSESSASGSPSFSRSSLTRFQSLDTKDGQRKSVSRKGNDSSSVFESLSERTQAGELFSATAKGRKPLPSGTTIADQMDLLREMVKMLAGEVALSTSSLKRLSEQASGNPEDLQIQEQMQKLKDEIHEKKLQMLVLEKRMVGSFETSQSSDNASLSQALSELSIQLSEKTFELEIMSADNRVLQEQLQMKISENSELQDTVALLKQQVGAFSGEVRKSDNSVRNCLTDSSAKDNELAPKVVSSNKSSNEDLPSNSMSLPCTLSKEESEGYATDISVKTQVLMQAAEIENLKQEKVRLVEEKDGLEIHSQKLAEEASYAKELAAAAAVELKNLAEEVTRLSYQNAKLIGDLAVAKDLAFSRTNNGQRYAHFDVKQDHSNNLRMDGYLRKGEDSILIEELKKELVARCQREASLEAELSERDQREDELQQRLSESKQHEEGLENELANMWVLVAKLKRSGMLSDDTLAEELNKYDFQAKQNGFASSNGNSGINLRGNKVSDGMNTDDFSSMEEVSAAYECERRRCRELEVFVSRLKGEELDGLDVRDLEDLQSFHVEALSKLCKEKMTNRSR